MVIVTIFIDMSSGSCARDVPRLAQELLQRADIADGIARLSEAELHGGAVEESLAAFLLERRLDHVTTRMAPAPRRTRSPAAHR